MKIFRVFNNKNGGGYSNVGGWYNYRRFYPKPSARGQLYTRLQDAIELAFKVRACLESSTRESEVSIEIVGTGTIVDLPMLLKQLEQHPRHVRGDKWIIQNPKWIAVLKTFCDKYK